MRKIDELKLKLKTLAKEIKLAKVERKLQRGKVSADVGIANDWKVKSLSFQFRCNHIAYCELRGRTRLQIEPKVREFNEPNSNLIEKIKLDYAWETDMEVSK